MKETMPTIASQKPEKEPKKNDSYIESFCAGWQPETDEEQAQFEESLAKLEHFFIESSQEGPLVSFNKYKKEFTIDGEIVPKSYFAVAPIWDRSFSFQDGDNFPLEYKNMRQAYEHSRRKEKTSEILSPVIARIQAQREKKKDIFISNAYSKIAERFEDEKHKKTESLGSQAERVVRSFLTRISAEHQDLKISIHPANPYQDVAEKIDFIIEATTKKRGVGIEADERVSQTLGIQFTVNNSKLEHKQGQIDKAKNRGTDVDDIILVSMNQEILTQALGSWKNSKSHFAEPAEYIASPVREKLLRELFANLLSPEDVEKIVKKYA